MLKRVFLVALCMVFLAATIAACGTPAAQQSASTQSQAQTQAQAQSQDQSQSQAQPAANGKKLKIFMTSAFYTAPYAAPWQKAATEKAQQLGVDLQIADGKADAQVQLDQINNAISQKVDGIIYWPADMASSVNIVKKLLDSKIPFVVVNSKVDPSVMDQIPAYVGPDVYKQGRVAADMANEAVGGKAANVVIVEGAGGTEAQVQRTQGFLDEIKDKNYPLTILDKQQADWDPAKALTVTENFITKYGDKINIIYTHDDGMFQGAYKAAQEHNVADKIKFISIGANTAGVAAIKAGQLYGSCTQSPILEGQMSVQTIVDMANGKTVPKIQATDSVPVTSANVSKYNGDGW